MKFLLKHLKVIDTGKKSTSISLCISLFTIGASVGIGVTWNPEKTLASACAGVYSTRNIAGTGQSKIGYYNRLKNTYVDIATYTGGENINAVATQPSTGNLFFVNRSTGKIIVYNPNTSSFNTLAGTLPGTIGSIIGATFSASGQLYIYYGNNKTLIEVNPSTGNQIGSTINISGIPGNSGGTTNGDIAIGTDGILYAIGDTGGSGASITSQLYSITISGTTATATPVNGNNNISGASSVNGLAIDPSTGKFYISTGSGTYELNTTTKVATQLTSAVGTNDLAACGSPTPNLPTITKSFSPSTVTGIPANSTLTLTLGNSNSVPIYLIQTLTDNFQSGLTVRNPNGLSGTCIGIPENTVTAVAGSSSISLNDGFKIPAGGCTVSVNVTASSAGTYTNNIAPGALRTFVGDNNGAASATLVVTTTISGTLYEDSDGDDTFDTNEPKLPAITVKLLDSSNNVIQTTNTDANGAYTFTNVSNGNYKIQVDTSDTDIPIGYTLGTPNDLAVTVAGSPITNKNFGFDPPAPSGSAYCTSPYSEVYSGQTGNTIVAVHGPTGAFIPLTTTAKASTVNSLAADHNNHLVYYAEGTAVYAWNVINNTHITITSNIRTFNSAISQNPTVLTAGGGAFYNGSLYLGVDPPSAGVFDIYKIDFVPGSNGATIKSVTPLGINATGKANGALNDGDWGDMIINDDGVIIASSGGTAKYWSFDLKTNTFTDLVDNIPQSSQLAKDGSGRLWAFRNGTNSVWQIEIVGNQIRTVGSTAQPTGTHSSADAGECVIGLSSIGDRVWNDTNGNGVQDSGENGLANVTVDLYRDINGNGKIDANEPKLATQTTDANGNYNFQDLIFGNYIIKVTDNNKVLTGKTLTTSTDTLAVNLPTGIQNYQNADFGYNQPVASNPNLLLIKRITRVNNSTTTRNGDNLAAYIDEASNFYDDNTLDNLSPSDQPDTDKWMDVDNDGKPDLIGGINGGNVQPNDEIEYTIYYLSAGDTTANNVMICDRVPENVTFMPTAFNNFATKNASGLQGADRGIMWQYNGVIESLSNINDGDAAEYLAPGIEPNTKYPGIKCDGTNTNGIVVVKLGNLPNATAPGVPLNSYGFIRFRGRVK